MQLLFFFFFWFVVGLDCQPDKDIKNNKNLNKNLIYKNLGSGANHFECNLFVAIKNKDKVRFKNNIY